MLSLHKWICVERWHTTLTHIISKTINDIFQLVRVQLERPRVIFVIRSQGSVVARRSTMVRHARNVNRPSSTSLIVTGQVMRKLILVCCFSVSYYIQRGAINDYATLRKGKLFVLLMTERDE